MGNIIHFPDRPQMSTTDELAEKFVEAGWFDEVSDVPVELLRFVTTGFQKCYDVGKKTQEVENALLETIAYCKGYEDALNEN